jgi:hypothetical protein
VRSTFDLNNCSTTFWNRCLRGIVAFVVLDGPHSAAPMNQPTSLESQVTQRTPELSKRIYLHQKAARQAAQPRTPPLWKMETAD